MNIPDSRRVVITGLGVVSALGIGVDTYWQALLHAPSPIAPVTRTLAGFTTTQPAAVLSNYRAADHFDPDKILILDPFSQFALIAAREAVQQARLLDGSADPSRIAVILGTGGGGEQSREAAGAAFFYDRRERFNPLLVPKTNHQAAVGLVSIEFGTHGPAFSVNSGCASSAHAISQAALLIRAGLADSAITGGSEANVLLTVLKSFQSIRVLADDTCRPFSLGRKGMVLGEGAGVIVLESLLSARRRGAPILAELAGFGLSADAHDSVHPTVEGPASAMRLALQDAQLDPQDIQLINAHGTGTPTNDLVETRAIHQVFGPTAQRLVVSATKAKHGHAFGASAALEFIATVCAIRHGIAPPTANALAPDPACDLDYLFDGPRSLPISAALSNSFAFGGLNAVLAIRAHA